MTISPKVKEIIELCLRYLKVVMGVCFWASVTSLLLSCVLVILFGSGTISKADSFIGLFVFYSAILSAFTVMCSPFALVILSVNYLYQKQRLWPLIKTDLLLLASTISLYFILMFCMILNT